MGQSSSIRIGGIALILCLAIAGVLTLMESPPQPGERGPVNISHISPEKSSTQSAGSTVSAGKSNRIRILWFNSAARTYLFQDYDHPEGIDPSTWTDTDLPAPDLGSEKNQAAMIRFISWNGSQEEITGTKNLVDQDRISDILNSYTLIASPSSGKPLITPGPGELSPAPTPAPGMLIPTMEQPCNQGDGTITVSCGYTSRHTTAVSLPVGERNQFSPGNKNRGQPVTFFPGVHKGVFTVTYPENGPNIVWNLMNTVVGAGSVPSLKAGFIAEPKAGYAPLTVWFTDQSSGGTQEKPLTGFWNVSEGSDTEGDTVTHRYEHPGRYQVSRTIISDCGTRTATAVIQVYHADFTVEPVPGSPRTYRFTDTSEGTPEVWAWDFNDGFSSWESGPVHTFSSPGTYTVGMTISGKNGSATAVHPVHIE